MTPREDDRESLDGVLKSVSDVLFPAGLGEAQVDINSTSSDGDTPLHVVIWRGDRHAAALLIRSGANVNAVGDMGETPLHAAIRQDDPALVEMLLDAGADPQVRSAFGTTAREMAKRRGGEIWAVFERLDAT
jgi:ankyrin repeat protein